MEYTEKISWILDKDKKIGYREDTAQQNIDFVHSLGLKCDRVGWSDLNLSSPRAPDILAAIDAFCKENGWGARGWYTREFAETESDWYSICFATAKDNFVCDTTNVATDNGSTTTICTVKAYQELTVVPKQHWLNLKLVPERFLDACTELGIHDMDYCWARDTGKYAAEQYFHIYPHHAVSHTTDMFARDFSFEDSSRHTPEQTERIQALGGALPRLAEIFYNLHIALPSCFLAEELPTQGFSSAYIEKSRSFTERQNILIHKNTAALLIAQKALSASILKPVPVVAHFPAGYKVLNTTRQSPPAKAIRDALFKDYEELKTQPRPVRMVTEKEALKMLRNAKKKHKESFNKALSKNKADLLAETEYAPMLPYYKVSDGGNISDEFQFLSHHDSIDETTEFFADLQAEELLDNTPNGIVIAKCANGDAVLLCKDETVIRFSHEAPEIINYWPSLHQFVADALTEEM